MKTPKFLLCENPMTADRPDRLFILHMRSPMILAEVQHIEKLSDDKRMEIERYLPIYGRLDYDIETIYFLPTWIEEGWSAEFSEQVISKWYNEYLNNGGTFTYDQWTRDSRYSNSDIQQAIADELAAIMRRMADWYEAYLRWEDTQ